MDSEKLQKLNKLLNSIKKDVVTPGDIEMFLVAVLSEIKQAKEDLKNLTKEQVDEFEGSIKQLKQRLGELGDEISDKITEKEEQVSSEFLSNTEIIHRELSDKIEQKTSGIVGELKLAIDEANKIITELK